MATTRTSIARRWLSLRWAQVAVVASWALAGCLAGCLPDRLSDSELDEVIAEASYASSCSAQVDCALAPACVDVPDCREACIQDATGVTAEHITATLACRDTCVERDCKALTGAKYDDCASRCLVYGCAREVLSCAAPEPVGAAICTDIFGCLATCLAPASGGAVECFGNCAENLTPVEFVLASKVVDCMSVATSDGKPFATTCSAEVATCYAGGVSDSGECFESFGCAETCGKLGKSATTCARECISQLNVSAQNAYIKYAQCLMDHPVVAKACDPDFIVCADPKGSLTCSAAGDEIQKCVGKSGTEAAVSCMAIGVHQSKPGAAKALVDYVRCFTDNCASACPKTTSPGCALCLTTKCKTQADACNKN